METRALCTGMVYAALALTTVPACTATVDGTASPVSDAGQSTRPLTAPETRPTSPPAPTESGSLNLPAELSDFTMYTDYAGQTTTALFAHIVMNMRSWSDALGTPVPVPIPIPRTEPSDCLIADRLARTCGNRIEYDVDQMSEDRDDFGDLVVVLIAAHETGHHVSVAAGGDTPSTEDTDAEARADCFAGAYIATNPTVTAQDAGTAFQLTPLPQAGEGSYTAFKRGFSTIRDGVNPVATCVAVTG